LSVAISEIELVSKVIGWVRTHMQPGVADSVEVTGETDLFASGLLDSLGLADLMLFVDSLEGCEVDLTDVEPSEYCVVRGLCSIALRNRQNPIPAAQPNGNGSS